MRLVFPTVTNNGFGNNVITLAKAHLIAETCHMTYQPPVWGPCEHVQPPTPNGYGYYFPSSRADRVRLRLLDYQFRAHRKLGRSFLWPTLDFRPEDYERLGIVDMGEAGRAFLRARGLDDPSKSVVLTTGGMWGGYASIRRARGWIHDLMRSHAETRRRLDDLQARTAGKLRVTVQIRLGDFLTAQQTNGQRHGERGVRLPLDWYLRVCEQIRQHADCTFILQTDGTADEVRPFLERFDPVHTLGEPYQDLLGALLIAEADLVVCSNSTYSRLGCFLSDKPYIWPADTLVPDDSGRFGYLFKERGPAPRDGRPAEDEGAVRRCFALRVDFERLPEGLRCYLESNGTAPIDIADDLLYRDAVYLLPN